MSDYPKTVTTNDGCCITFSCEVDEIQAYKRSPWLYRHKPEGIKDEVIAPAVLVETPVVKEVPKVEVPKVEVKKPRGRPARRW